MGFVSSCYSRFSKADELWAVEVLAASPNNVLLRQISSTVGGTGYCRTEISNTIQCEQDVVEIMGCPPEKIAILGIDMGQACVIGAYALFLPDRNDAFFNLAVKQKAVYQPVFKHQV